MGDSGPVKNAVVDASGTTLSFKPVTSIYHREIESVSNEPSIGLNEFISWDKKLVGGRLLEMIGPSDRTTNV